MAQFSVIFNPATDNLEEVLQSVENLFGIFGALVPDAETATTAAAQAAQPVVNNTPNFDSTGLPWDARIHSTPAAQTTKGVWRAKRGADPQLVLQVEAELRAANPATVAAPAVAAPAVAAPAVAAPAVAAPVAPAMPTMPAMPQAPAPVAPSAYANLVKLIGDNLHSAENPNGRLNNDWVQQALAAYQVPGGLLQNAATMAEADVANIVAGITQALGL